MAAPFTLGPLGAYTVNGFTPPLYWGLSALADLDGDGLDDFIQTGAYYPNEPYPDTARVGFVLFGGAAGFVPATPAELPTVPLSVHAREFAFADFNEDGVPDFFVADTGYDAPPFPGRQNQLFLSTWQGAEPAWVDATARLPQVADFTHSVTVGDVNADGHADIFVGNGGLADSYLLLGDGTGAFTRDTLLLPQPPVNVGLDACLLFDLDLDGWEDLVLGTGLEHQDYQMFWSDGGTFAGESGLPLVAPSDFGTDWWIYDIVPADVNYDGLPDLLVTSVAHVVAGGWAIQVLVNNGDRTFSEETAAYIPDAGVRSGGVPGQGGDPSWIEFLLPRDVNGDGRTDFVVQGKGTGQPLGDDYPVVLLHQPGGHFETVRAGELRDAGLPGGIVDYGPRLTATATGHEFLQVYRDLSGQLVEVGHQGVTFTPAATHWQGGTQADDSLEGTPGADDMGGFGGNDTLAGGAGFDIARYNATRAEIVLQSEGGTWEVSSAADGSDRLVGVERLKLADGWLALDIEGNAGSVAKVIGAVFGPEYLANEVFVGIGLQLLDGGMDAPQLAALAVQTGIFTQLAGSGSDEDFVRFVYANVMGSAPGEGELGYFVGLLQSGAFTQGELAFLACETAQNLAAIDFTGLAQSGLGFIPA